MKTSDFYFDLPGECIAQYPAERGKSRLMVLDRALGTRRHALVSDLPLLLGNDKLKPLLVFNNSKVRRARIFAAREQDRSAPAEFLLIDRVDAGTWHVITNRKNRRSARYVFKDGRNAELLDGGSGNDSGSGFSLLRFDDPIDDFWLETYGHVPLPPYIKRGDEAPDHERYQTVYADASAGAFGPGGSAAAPTAGLHFTRELLNAFTEDGIECAFVTLHVGPGTFLPVRAERIEDHRLHSEQFTISAKAAAAINGAYREGRPIIAVGTTSVRTLESAWNGNGVNSGEASTSIFIFPGYDFKMINGIITNFHTPESSLLMLVCAFAEGAKTGREFILESYQCAIREGYRFFSYGDAMLLR
ncbi:MAG: tRNA preQ1(34) S-adenosylmethionine ribosyltransferase-isomerase QueA [Treponema sp.]|nr:tRNA preQ1(34) S-adenosylmethionine ribosyltransferase-isomerase QueA [Treponema sp.]